MSPPTNPSTSFTTQPAASTLSEFFNLDWVNAPGAQPEILFLKRDKPDLRTDAGRMSGSGPDSKEAHVAFPGELASHTSCSEVQHYLFQAAEQKKATKVGCTLVRNDPTLPSTAQIDFHSFSAMRQTWEEIGLDLAENAYLPIGQLDDREITTSLGKRLLMILSPFVFLQLTPQTTPVDPTPGTSLHWVPLTELLPDSITLTPAEKNGKSKVKPKKPRWSSVTVDASSRLAPRHSTVLRLLVRLLVGSMKFPAIVIETSYPTVTLAHSDHEDEKFIDEKRGFVENGVNGHVPLDHKSSLLRPRGRRDEHMKLWGLSLGMTLDLLAFMAPPPAFASVNGNGNGYYATGNEAFVPPDAQTESMGLPVMAPSLTSVFPRFSYPDVNFWIW